MKINYQIKPLEFINITPRNCFIGMKIYCIKDLVMRATNEIASIKGKTYIVQEYGSQEFIYTDEANHRHTIKFDKNTWFKIKL